MLYLGQVCRFKEDEKESIPAIFLGFVKRFEKGAKSALIVHLTPEGLKSETITLDKVGFVREEDKTSPTGYRIFHGDFCKDIVDEHIVLKWPDVEVARGILKKATKLMSNSHD